MNDIVNKLAQGSISQSEASSQAKNIGIWQENGYENIIEQIQVTINETTSNDISYIYNNFHKNFTTDSQHYIPHTRAAIYYDSSGNKYKVVRVGFVLAKAVIQEAEQPPVSQYYSVPPKTTGYNTNLTNIYNQYFAQNKYNGVKANEFNNILMKVSSGSISVDEAKNSINNIGIWQENGKAYYIYSVVVDQVEYNSDDAKVLYDMLYKTTPSQSIAYVNTGILYKSQFLVNRVFRLVVNIAPVPES